MFIKITTMKDNQLFNGSLIFFLVVAGGLMISLFNDQSKGFSLNNAEVLKEMNGNGYLMNYIEFLEQYNPGDKPITYIDLRHEEQFQDGHLNNALNIPLNKLLDSESLKALRNAEGELVLYSDSQSTTVMAVMMLKYVGFDKVRALAGSYDVVSEKILNDPDPLFFFHHEEKARWHYKNFMENAQKPQGHDVLSQPQLTIEGGC